jgi:prepilin peptidase CpaA
MLLTTLWNSEMILVQWGIVIGSALAGASYDVLRRRVPNLLTLPVLLAGLVWATVTAGLPGLADAALGCAMLMLPFFILFVWASGGAGDAKLMGALGAWLGTVNGLAVLLCVVTCGLVMGIGWALAQRRLGEVLRNIGRTAKAFLMHVVVLRSLKGTSLEVPKTSQMKRMPYGPAIFGGVCLAAIGVFIWRAG